MRVPVNDEDRILRRPHRVPVASVHHLSLVIVVNGWVVLLDCERRCHEGQGVAVHRCC